MRRTRWSLAAAALLSAVALFGSATPTWANPGGSDKGKVETRTQTFTLDAPSWSAARNGEMTVAVDPPLGGCNFQSVGGTVTSYYVGGVLTRTETLYSGDLNCLTTAPGQTMEYMMDISKLQFGGSMVDEGELVQCHYNGFPGDQPCTFVFSAGDWNCYGGVGCAGTYMMWHFPGALLPAGWAWTRYDTTRCSLLSPRELNCGYETNPVVVPPVI